MGLTPLVRELVDRDLLPTYAYLRIYRDGDVCRIHTPKPNGWSVYLFLHWVDRDGPYRDHAFDGHGVPTKANFSFA